MRACPKTDWSNPLSGDFAQQRIGQTGFWAALPNEELVKPIIGRACPTKDWSKQLPGELAQQRIE